MGLLAAVIGMGLAAGDTAVATVAIFYAVHHTLVKGGLFLAIGAGAQTRGAAYGWCCFRRPCWRSDLAGCR